MKHLEALAVNSTARCWWRGRVFAARWRD